MSTLRVAAMAGMGAGVVRSEAIPSAIPRIVRIDSGFQRSPRNFQNKQVRAAEKLPDVRQQRIDQSKVASIQNDPPAVLLERQRS